MDVNLEEKALIVARYIPCDQCSCLGWRSTTPLCTEQNDQIRQSDSNNMCQCGHGALEHVEQWKDIDRRLQLAQRIKDILQENGKDDEKNVNDSIQNLQRQILENAPTQNDISETSSLSRLDPDGMSPKRDRKEVNTVNETKRQKTDLCDHGKGEDQPGHGIDENVEGGVVVGNDQGGMDNPSVDIAHFNQQQQQQQAQLNTPKENPPENTTLLPSLDSNTNEDHLFIKESVDTGGFLHKDNNGNGVYGSTNLPGDHALLIKGEPLAMMEERKGDIVIKHVLNDGEPENMIYLTGLKNIFQKQLPMMPKEYITRLVYDRKHRCVALIRRPLKVIGGICYRPFDEQDFAEIVFCAVSSTEQVRGYGAHLMNYLKDYVTTQTVMRYFLTYADNSATGYFKKQGFTTDITLNRRKWVGFIKDYEGGTIMQCSVTPGVNYLQTQQTLEPPTSHGALSRLEVSMDDSVNPLSIPGVCESSGTSEMDLSTGTKHPPHYLQMRQLVLEMQYHANSWPFRKPVNMEDAADYYEVIRNPMDLATLERNVEKHAYTTMNDFVIDVQKMFDNCRTYNPEGTIYTKCATLLEQYFYERFQVWSGRAN